MAFFDDCFSRSHISSLLVENYRARSEALQFISHEVRFARKWCATRLARSEAHFWRCFQQRFELLDQSIACLTQHINSAYSFFGEQAERTSQDWNNRTYSFWQNWADASLAMLGTVLQDSAVSAAQRRYRSASSATLFQTVRPATRLRLSEVHLDYPDTLRAITSVVDDYFARIRVKYLPGGMHMFDLATRPIVAVSRGRSFCLESFCGVNEVPLFLFDKNHLDDITANAHENVYNGALLRNLKGFPHINRYISMQYSFSSVVTPRYFPVMIRYSALLSHELFHPVVKAAEVIHAGDPRFSNKDEEQLSAAFEKRCANHGPALATLAQDRLRLQSSIRRFLRSVVKAYRDVHEIDHAAVATESASADEESVARRSFVFYFDTPSTDSSKTEKGTDSSDATLDRFAQSASERCAKQYAREFLTDLAGFYISPSYLLALTCSENKEDISRYYLDDENRLVDIGLGWVWDEHPPMIVRIELLCHLAESIGFVRLAKKARSLWKEHHGQSPSADIHQAVLDVWMQGWLRSKPAEDNPPNRDLVLDIFKNIADEMPLSTVMKSAMSSGPNSGLPWFDESRLTDWFETLITHIESGKVHWKADNALRTFFGHDFCSEEEDQLWPSDILNALWYRLTSRRFNQTSRKRLQWRLALCKNKFRFEEARA